MTPHGVPLYDPIDVIVLVRTRGGTLVPHVLVQTDHLDQEDMTQSMGHESVLHVSDCVALHDADLDLLLVCVPPPHVAVHVLQLPHAGIGEQPHGSLSHARLSDSSPGQATPPLDAGTRMDRDRDCVPPAQVTVQELQEE